MDESAAARSADTRAISACVTSLMSLEVMAVVWARSCKRGDDAQADRNAEIGADERFLQFIPIDGLAGKFLNERFEKIHG